jgi:glycosyltransferase involved in cell wall biosynthesis
MKEKIKNRVLRFKSINFFHVKYRKHSLNKGQKGVFLSYFVKLLVLIFKVDRNIVDTLVFKIVNKKSRLKDLISPHLKFMVYIYKNEPCAWRLWLQKKRAKKISYTPLISIIIPVYRVPQSVLQALLVSLERQTYSHWQACIAWSDSDDADGWQWLQTRTQNDPRFKLKRLSENGGISRNSNAALELVEGDYVALLDHDDILTPWAFFMVIRKLQENPKLDFIYSDKDLIFGHGYFRLQPLFKPGWSPEMLNSANYLTHLNVIRTQLLHEVGGWRFETDGAQDWDLFLRISERTQNIGHIPSILYHWRMLSTSTALDIAIKPYVPKAQLKTVQDAFLRRSLTATVTPVTSGFHIDWPLKPYSTDVVLFQSGTAAQLTTLLNQIVDQQSPLINRIIVIHKSILDHQWDVYKAIWADRLLTYHDGSQQITWRTALSYLSHTDLDKAILFLDGSANRLSSTLLQELTGWVNHHPDISWVSAIALDNSDTCYEVGRVVSPSGESAPLFRGAAVDPAICNYLGSPVWYRNVRACSPYAIAFRSQAFSTAIATITAKDDRTAFTQFCLALTAQGGRGLVNPFAKIYFEQPPEHNWPNEGSLYHEDPHFHPSFKQVSPFKLN